MTRREKDAELALALVERRAQLRALLGEDSYAQMVAAAKPTIAARFDLGDCVNHIQAALRLVEDLVADPPPDMTHRDLSVSVCALLVTGAFHMREAQP